MNWKVHFYKLVNFSSKVSFHIRERLGGIMDSLLLLLGIKETSLIINENPEQYILFVGKEPNFRVLKFIKWINKSNGRKVILAVHSAANSTTINALNVSALIKFRNHTHLIRMLKNSNLTHMITFTSSPFYARIAIENFNGKKIFDPYDCLAVYYGLSPHLAWMKKEIPNEKFCFEKTDAVLARNLESKQSMKLYGVENRKNIVFSDYCDNDCFSFKTKPLLLADSEINLVYSGGLYGRSARSSSHGIENFDELISTLIPNKIHLHLYPNPMSPLAYYYDFIEDAKTNSFLHIYPSVPQAKLGEVLSEYTFGILPHFKDPDSLILDAKLQYGTSNKFFNFLEAGIPIIVSDEMIYMAWLVKRYRIGIVISREDLSSLRSKILSANYLELQKNVKIVREKLSMKQNIHRLNQFLYESK